MESKMSLILRVVVTRVVSHFSKVHLRHISLCFSLLASVMGLKGIRAPDPAVADPKRFWISGKASSHQPEFSLLTQTLFLAFINLSGSGTDFPA